MGQQAVICNSESDYTLSSAYIAIEGWDFPEAAYVACLGHLQQINLPHITAKAGCIRSSGCHNLWSARPPPGKNSRTSVSGGKVPALQNSCGVKCIGVSEIRKKRP